jgi:hypothetical protein
MTLNLRPLLFVIVAIASIIPIFYLVQYLDSTFSYWWAISWCIFIVVLGVIIRKSGFQKYIPHTRNSLLIHTFIPIFILSAIVVYVTVITQHISLSLVGFFGGLIVLLLVIYYIRVKTQW